MLNKKTAIQIWTKDGCVRCHDLGAAGVYDTLSRGDYELKEWQMEPLDWENHDELIECTEAWTEACVYGMFLYGDKDMPWVYMDGERYYGEEAFEKLKSLAEAAV